MYNPQNSSAQPTSNGSTTPTSTTMPVPEFSLSIDGSSRVSPTSNAVRNTCRDMVYKAMKKGLSDGMIHMHVKYQERV